MNALLSMLPEGAVWRLGWALLHFVWQGAVIALAAGIVLVMLRRRSAGARYVVASGAMLLMLAAAIGTFVLMVPPPPPARATTAAVSKGPVVERPADQSREVSVVAQAAPVQGLSPRIVLVETTPTVDPLWRRVSAKCESYLPWVVTLWMAGLLLLSVRLLGGWVQVQRIRRCYVDPLGGAWQVIAADLADRLQVSRPVRLLSSGLAQVPVAIGWLRPVILLPVATLTNLTTDQLEAILAHELAHIRRYDYVANIIQSAIETVLFYHPGVWWVSRRIRAERENCCDDLAIAACGNRLVYARALAEVEQLRAGSVRLAAAATGGTLMTRIRRIVGLPTPDHGRSARWLAGVFALAVVLTAAIGVRMSASAEAQIPLAQTNESIARLKRIMTEMYALAGDVDKPVRSFQALVDAGVLKPEDLISPLAKTTTQASYIHVPYSNQDARDVVAFENPADFGGKGTIILWGDSHIDYHEVAELWRALTDTFARRSLLPPANLTQDGVDARLRQTPEQAAQEAAARWLDGMLPAARFAAEIVEQGEQAHYSYASRPTERRLWVPPGSTSSNYRFWVDGARFRMERQTRDHDSEDGRERVYESTYVNDGKIVRQLNHWVSAFSRSSQDSGSERASSDDAIGFYCMLVFPLGPTTQVSANGLKPSLGASNQTGQVVLTLEYLQGGNYRIYMDPLRDYQPCRVEYFGWDVGHPMDWRGLTRTAEYELGLSDGHWYPSTIRTFRLDASGKPQPERIITVKLVRNPVIPDTQFVLDFPSGTRVWCGELEEKDRQRIVGKDELPDRSIYDRPKPEKRPDKRDLLFPDSEAVGTLMVRDWQSSDDSAWEPLGEARGTVEAPAGKHLKLVLKRAASSDLRFLARLGDRLDVLSVVGAGVTDSQARYIGSLSRLNELDISSNPITDAGLRYLHTLRGLRRLNLRGTRVTAAGIRVMRQARPDCEIDADSLSPTGASHAAADAAGPAGSQPAGDVDRLKAYSDALQELTAQVAEVAEQKNQAKAAYDRLLQAVPSAPTPLGPEMEWLMQQDPEVYWLVSNKAALAQELQFAIQQVGPNAQAVEVLRARIAALDNRLAETRARKAKELSDYRIGAAKTTYIDAMQKELVLREQMVEVEARYRNLKKARDSMQRHQEQLDELRRDNQSQTSSLPGRQRTTQPGEPQSSTLEFRIVPNAIGSSQMPVLSPLTDYRADLARNGPMAARDRGDEFVWFELVGAGKDLSAGQSMIASYQGREFMLLCNREPHILVPPAGARLGWGIRTAALGRDATNRSTVNLKFDEALAQLFGEFTERNLGNGMAILLDGKVVTAATIRSKITGNCQITGNYTKEQVEGLLAGLRTGWTMSSQPASAPAGRPASALEGGGFTVPLSNGATVELIGIHNNGGTVEQRGVVPPEKVKPGWRPDGAPLDEPPYDSFDGGGLEKGRNHHNPYDFVIRVTGVAEDAEPEWPQRGYGGGTIYKDGVRVPGLRVRTMSLSKDQPSTTLSLALPTGPWRTLASFKSLGVQGDWGSTFVVEQADGSGAIVMEPGGTCIKVISPMTDRQARIVAVDLNGRVHPSAESGRSLSGNLTVIWGAFRHLSWDEIKEFRFEYRLYDRVEFRNVSLIAGHHTEVRTEVERAATIGPPGDPAPPTQPDSVEGLDRKTVQMVYDIRDLLEIRDPASRGHDDTSVEETRAKRLQVFQDLIRKSIEPGSWEPEGTLGSIAVWNDRLIIRHTESVHRRLAGVFHQIRTLPEESGALAQRFQAATTQPAGPQIAVEVRFITAPAKSDDTLTSGFSAWTTVEARSAAVDHSTELEGVLFRDGVIDIARQASINQSTLILDDRQAETLLRRTQGVSTSSVVIAPRLVVYSGHEGLLTVGSWKNMLLPVLQPGGDPPKRSAPVYHGRDTRVTATLRPDLASVTMIVDAGVDFDGVFPSLEAGVPVVSRIPVLKRAFTRDPEPRGDFFARIALTADVPLGRTLLIRSPLIHTSLKGLRAGPSEAGRSSYTVVREIVPPGNDSDGVLYLLVKPSLCDVNSPQ